MTTYLKALEKYQEIMPKESRWEEINSGLKSVKSKQTNSTIQKESMK